MRLRGDEVAPERGGKCLNRKLGEVIRFVPHVDHPTLRVRVSKLSGSKDRRPPAYCLMQW